MEAKKNIIYLRNELIQKEEEILRAKEKFCFMTFCLNIPEFGAVGSGFVLIGVLLGCLLVCCSQRWCLTWTTCCGGFGCCGPCCLSGFSDKSKLASEERLLRISINEDD